MTRIFAQIAVIGLLLIPHGLSAEERFSSLAARSWRVSNGMPDQVVQAIRQTPDHLLWIGTPSGLIRFDGSTFSVYEGAGKDALSHGVTSLRSASDGSLYAGTEGGGLVRLHDGKAEVFGPAQGLRDLIVRDVLEDGARHIWVATDHGVFVADDALHFRYGVSHELYPNLGSAALLKDRSGAIWSGGSNLLRITPARTEEFSLAGAGVSTRVKSILQDDHGTIIVGGVSGLYTGDEAGNFKRVDAVHGAVRVLGRLPSGEVFAGTAGYGFFVRRHGEFTADASFGHLPANTVLSSAPDDEGNVWIGFQAGLIRLSRSQIGSLPGVHNGSDFGTVAPDPDGAVWSCSTVVQRIAQGAATVVHPSWLGADIVRTILHANDGSLWIGTAGNGAFRVLPDGHREHFTSEIGTNYIRGFLQATDGGVWIATDGGIALWSQGHVQNLHELPFAPHTMVNAMVQMPDGRLWIGTQRGLYTFDHGRFNETDPVPTLPDGPVWALHDDPAGNLWIGTSAGLFVVTGGRLLPVPLPRLGRSRAIYRVMEAGQGRLWISGPTHVVRAPGLALLAWAQGQGTGPEPAFDIYPVSDELDGAELYAGMEAPGVALPDGSAWFASSLGPLHVQPATATPGIRPWELAINRVTVDGKSAALSPSLSIGADSQMLEFNFTPLMLSSQSRLRYRWRVRGFSSWGQPTTSRTASYTNLPPGNYVFEVQAVDTALHPLATAQLPFRKLAHFYQTVWFWLLCAIVVSAAAWLFHRLRVARLHASFLAVTAERNRMAREMHDTLIQGCTAVSALLEAASAPSQSEAQSQGWLQHARTQIRTTIAEARAAVLDLRTEADPSPLDEALRKMSSGESVVKGTAITFTQEGIPLPVSGKVTHELTMAAREALINAVTHSAATHIRLSLNYGPADIRIRIADDGAGFDPARVGRKGHFGLLGMYERMTAIRGECRIDAAEGHGTSVELRYAPRKHQESRHP